MIYTLNFLIALNNFTIKIGTHCIVPMGTVNGNTVIFYEKVFIILWMDLLLNISIILYYTEILMIDILPGMEYYADIADMSAYKNNQLCIKLILEFRHFAPNCG